MAGKFLISGAGIAGLALARLFKKAEIPFVIIEKRKTSSAEDGVGIALPANAMLALRAMDLDSKISRLAHQVSEITYTNFDGAILSSASLLEPPLNSAKFVALQRSDFYKIMAEGLENEICYDTEITSLEQVEDEVTVSFNNSNLKQQKFAAVIGADGVNSQVRKLVFGKNCLSDLGVSVWRWLAHYPNHKIQPIYMFESKSVFMAYPISDDKIYCYAHVVDPQNLSSKSTNHADSLQKHFSHYGTIAKKFLAKEMLPQNDFIIPGRLLSVSPPLFSFGLVGLIGDAGHACSPTLQQGVANALSDAITLAELCKKFSANEVLSKYQTLRQDPVRKIAELSDGPIKMMQNANPEMWQMLLQKIRANGPLNVLAWREMLNKI